MDLQTLIAEDIIRIHEVLVSEFAKTDNAIDPPGLKSLHLLESAVFRQHTSIKGQLKHSDPLSSAATLTYGICNDHPFHNGNKRTALVAMLVHLDKNKIALRNTRDKELFDLIIAVANHSVSIGINPKRKYLVSSSSRGKPDDEVLAIRKWLVADERADRMRREERQITFRQLRRLLERQGYSLVEPKGNSISVVKRVESRIGLLKRKVVVENKHIGSMNYPGDGEFVSMRDMKYVRKVCQLTEEHGCDSSSFYDEAAVLDTFVNRYRTILRRLASK